MIIFFFQRTRREFKNVSFFKTGRQERIEVFSVDGVSFHCNNVFEAMGCFYRCSCQEIRPFLTEKDFQRGSKKKKLVALRRHYIQEKDFNVIEMRECELSRLYKTTNTVKQHIREHFPYRRSLAAEQLLEKIETGKLFGYVQCDIEVPEELRSKFDNVPPKFKNTLVTKNDIGDVMKNYAEEKTLLSQSWKMLISRFILLYGTLITPLLLFYPEIGLVFTKRHRFVEYAT